MASRNLRANSEIDDCDSSSGSFDNLFECKSDDSSVESGGQISTRRQGKTKRLQTSNSSGVVKRLPTRRPDPNTFNRNAIMARENRKKKKEYLESLEKQVNCYKSVNRKLKNLLKHQSKVMDGLKNESKYYRSLLANKTQIISLINAVKNYNLPTGNTGNGNGSTILKPITNEGLRDYSEHDYDCLQEKILSWEELLDTNEFPSTVFSDGVGSSRESQKQVIDEHNYSNSHSDEDAEDPGVCLHVSSGKVSLKFCASCHGDNRVGLDLE